MIFFSPPPFRVFRGGIGTEGEVWVERLCVYLDSSQRSNRTEGTLENIPLSNALPRLVQLQEEGL